jgi:hypothetical protein
MTWTRQSESCTFVVLGSKEAILCILATGKSSLAVKGKRWEMKPVQSATPQASGARARSDSPKIFRRVWLWLRYLKRRVTGEDIIDELRELSANPDFIDAIEQARRSTRANGGTPHDEVFRELEAEQRAKHKK